MKQSILLTRPSDLVGSSLLNVLNNKHEVAARYRRRGDMIMKIYDGFKVIFRISIKLHTNENSSIK